jgi:hypothetical protein
MKQVALVALLFVATNAARAGDQDCAPLSVVTRPDKLALRSLVSVYWDVSGSVDGRFSSDVDFLIANLDSRVLPLAGAIAPIRHYAVGEDVVEAHDAGVAKSRHQMRSALPDASRAIAADLARGEISAAIFVTDLEVDRPELNPEVTAVCGDVPVPTDRGAGPLIGRCFSSGWRLAPTPPGGRKPARSIDHLLLTIFRSKYAAPIPDGISRKHLYILVFATDIEFGRKILAGLDQRLSTLNLGYDRFNVIDTSAAPRLSVARTTPSRSVRTASGYAGRCAFACYDEDAQVDLQIAIHPPDATAWVPLLAKPRVTAAIGNARAALRQGRRWDVVWTIPCVPPKRKLQERRVDVRFDWDTPQTIPTSVTIDHPDVEDAITSLLQAVPPLLTPRINSIVIGLR